MSEQHNHTMWVNRLIDTAKRGTILELQAEAPNVQQDPSTADQWPADRCIPASALRAALIADHAGFDPRGIQITGARIIGHVDLAHITFDYPLHLVQCRIDQQLNLGGAQLRELNLSTSHLQSLILDQAKITGSLVANSITNIGEIRAVGVTIGGYIDLTHAILSNAGGHSLILESATIGGSLFANNITSDGEIRAPGARIVGQLNLTGAILSNVGGNALTLDSATIGGSLVAENIKTSGQIRASGVTIDGPLNLTAAILSNIRGNALFLDSATIGGSLFANNITSDGEIRALGATIGGQLNLNFATLTNLGEPLLSLDGANITGEVFIQDLATAAGEITALGARFESLVELTNAKPLSGVHFSIDFQDATIQHLVLPTDSLTWIDLSQAKIAHLQTPANGEPLYPVIATGWTIGDITGRIRTDRAAATRWLNNGNERNKDVSPQPWHVLAEAYERNGHPAEARRLRLTAANKVTATAPWPTKIQRWAYLAVAGHGYYPLVATVWLVIALIGGIVLVETNREHFIPTNPAAATSTTTVGATGTSKPTPPVSITGADNCATHPHYPCLDSFTYALTSVIPAAIGITRPDWALSTTAPLLIKTGLPTLRTLSWIFTAILLAGVTGLLRKSS